MKLLLILLAVVLATNSLPRIEEDSSGPNWSQNGFKGVLQEPYNSSNWFHRRFSRANADNIKAPLERLQMIARITNGIYLYQGLSAGSIPSDTLISELLFFGSVKPSEISQMDYQKIQTAIELLGNLPKSLDATQDANKVEKAVAGLGAILKEVDGIGNIKEWTKGKEHFKKEIEKLASKGLNSTLPTKLGVAAGSWQLQYPNLVNDGAKAVKKDFSIINDALDSLKIAISDINNPVLEWDFTGSDTAMGLLSPITKAADGVVAYKANFGAIQITGTLTSNYSIFLETKAKEVDSFTAVTPQLASIKSLISTRKRRDRQRLLQHTHGLPNGVADVIAMLNNVGNPWIRRIVTTDALKIAFEKFGTLENLLNALETSLKVGDDGVAKIDKLVQHASLVVDVFANMTKVKTGLSQTMACPLPSALDVESQESDKLLTALRSIDTKLSALREQKKLLSDALKTKGLIEMCNDVIAICENAQKASDVQGFVDQFKNYKNLTELNKKIIQIDKIVTAIKTFDPESVKTEAETVKTNFPALDTYHTGLNHYADYFKCLQDKEELKLVFKMVSQINKTRGYKDDASYSTSLQDGLAVVKKVTGTKGELVKLKTAIAGWNGTATNGLEEFKKIDEHSKVIGGSVQGVANMRNALELKRTVEKVLSSLSMVKNNSQLVTDPKDKKNLDDLIGLEPVIQKMYSSLDTFNGVVKDSDSLILKNHSALFIQAKKLVTGISNATGKFLAMSSTIKELQTKMANPAQLGNLESSLKTMDIMGLDFAKYHTSFDKSESSLAAMDTFFAKYNKRMAPATPAPRAKAPGKPSSSNNGQSGEKKEEEGTLILTPILYGLAAVGVLAPVSTLLYIFALNPFIERRNMKLFLDRAMKEIGTQDANMRRPILGKKQNASVIGKVLTKFRDIVTLQNEPNAKGDLSDCERTMGCKGGSSKESWLFKKSLVVLTGFGNSPSDSHYHGVLVPLTKRRKVILGVSPLDDAPDEVCSAAKFYWMAKQYKCKTVVFMTPADDEHRIPVEKGDVIEYENVTIECLEKKVFNREHKSLSKLLGTVDIRKLRITFTGRSRQERFTIRSIQYYKNPLTKVRFGYEFSSDLACMAKIVGKYKGTTLLSSLKAREMECMCFVLYTIAQSKRNSKLTFQNVHQSISKHIRGAVSEPLVYFACVLAVYEFISQKVKVDRKSFGVYFYLRSCYQAYRHAQGGDIDQVLNQEEVTPE